MNYNNNKNYNHKNQRKRSRRNNRSRSKNNYNNNNQQNQNHNQYQNRNQYQNQNQNNYNQRNMPQNNNNNKFKQNQHQNQNQNPNNQQPYKPQNNGNKFKQNQHNNNQHQNQNQNQNIQQYKPQNNGNKFKQNQQNNNNNNNNYNQQQQRLQNRQRLENQYNQPQQTNIYNNLKSQALKRDPVNDNNNNNMNNDQMQQKYDITKSKLNPEIDSFSELQSASEKLFTQLQQLNTQLAGLKAYADTYIIPRLHAVNTDIVIWESPQNSHMLQYPTNYAEYSNLKAEQAQLQQLIFENQTVSNAKQAELEHTRSLYNKVLNEPVKPALPTFDDADVEQDENINNMNQLQQQQQNGNGFNGNIPIIDQTPNEETKEISEPPSIPSITPSRYNELQQRAPSVSSREYDDDNKTMDTESLQQSSMETDNESSNDNQQDDDEDEEEQEEEDEEEQYEDDQWEHSVEDEDDDKEDDEEEEEESEAEEDDMDQWKSDEDEPEQTEQAEEGEGGDMSDADTIKSAPKEINPGETRYSVKELVSMQSKYLDIDWKGISYMYKDPDDEDAEEEKIEVPEIAKFKSHTMNIGMTNKKYMENVVAAFMRKSDNAWVPPSHTGKRATNPKVILRKKLRGILNKMTPEKFDKIAARTINVVNEHASTKEMMGIIIEVVLGFAIQIPVFCDQYAKLCQHLKEHLKKITMICEFQWILDDKDLSTTFKNMVIIQTHNLFKKHRNYSPDNIHLDDDGKKIEDKEELDMKKSKFKKNFFASLSLAAELYNFELVNPNVIYKGIFDVLLPPQNHNLSSPDIEGLCEVLNRCGKKLDETNSRAVDKYLQKLFSHARKFDFRTKVLVEKIKEMRTNGWEERIKKAKATTLDKIKEEHDAQQQQNHRGGYRQQSRYDTYDDEDYMLGYSNNAPQQRGYNSNNRYNNNNNRYNNNNNASKSSSNLRSRRRNKNSQYRRVNNNGNNNNNHNAASQSSSNLRSPGNGRYGRSRYDNNNSNNSKGNNQSQRPSNPMNNSPNKPRGRRLVVDDFDEDFDNDNSSKKNDENENENDGGDITEKVNGLISEYLASGVIDDIIDLNCQDFDIWAQVINNSLRDRRTSEIDGVIEMIMELFKKKVLNNKGGKFVDIVINHLAKETDESSMDCPNFKKYLAKLFAKLCYKGYIKPEAYNQFITDYNQYSEYMDMGKKKTINKIIEASIDELQELNAKQSLISKIKKYSM